MIKLFFVNFNNIALAVNCLFLLAASYVYFKKDEQRMAGQFNVLFWSYLGFNVAWLLLETALQYWAFDASDLGKILVRDKGYFFRYVFTHFWLAWLIAVAVGLIMYRLLVRIGRYRDGLFYPGEAKLGFLAILSVGWPAQTVYLPIMLILSIITLVFRQLVLKEERTALGWPMVFAAFIALFFGRFLVESLGLQALILK